MVHDSVMGCRKRLRAGALDRDGGAADEATTARTNVRQRMQKVVIVIATLVMLG